MEDLKSYFFDTYALYELVHGSKNYLAYSEDISIITTKLNLMELYYLLLRNYNKDEAEKAFSRFFEFIVEIEDNIFKDAAEMRLVYKSKSFSFVDCIGYLTAKSRNIRFLTGDDGFKDLPDVEFVK